MCKRIFGLVLLLFVCWSAVAAEGMNTGMNQSEVLAAKGAPLEKIEYESKRQELWQYEDEAILFREGGAVAVSGGEASPSSTYQTPRPAKKAASADAKGVQESELSEILTEVMQRSSGAENTADNRNKQGLRPILP